MKPNLALSSISPHLRDGASRQDGVVLVIALIALVAITLASFALYRSVQTGLSAAGNIAFRSSATAISDIPMNKGMDWLQAYAAPDPTNTYTTSASGSYYAEWMSSCDLTGNRTPLDRTDDINWDGTLSNPNCNVRAASVAGLPAGYSGSYFVVRTCSCAGAPLAACPDGTENVCATPPGAGMELGHGTYDYVYRRLSRSESTKVPAPVSPYFRVIARIVGPRNTVSFTETIVTLN